MTSNPPVLKCLEWFSGIGGLHYALCNTGVPSVVVASFDINHLANAVYYHNFKQRPIAKNVEHLTTEYVDAFEADIWLMSPPCQPYTQGGKQRDDQDMRAIGFLHLIDMLPLLKHRPKYIFLENVPFFEVSNCHHRLIKTLEQLGYETEQYMVAPTDPVIGIPNRRKRYYLSARLLDLKETCRFSLPAFSNSAELITSLSQLSLMPATAPRALSDYVTRTDLETQEDASWQQYLVPLSFIEAAKDFRFDIVQPNSASCATFTKAYGSKYVIGTGSFLQTKAYELAFEPDDQTKLPLLGLRFFTPHEIADLHAFPLSAADAPKFEFPSQLTLIQKYRLLGNSLNVSVVACLLKRLLPEPW